MSKREGPTWSGDGFKKRKERLPRIVDDRIRRTRARLGDALIALMEAKPVDKITLREVLNQAAVGRSTFYLHYRDKNDLFLCVLEEGLDMWSTALDRNCEKSLRVVPVAEFFAHVASARKLYRALAEAGRLNDLVVVVIPCCEHGWTGVRKQDTTLAQGPVLGAIGWMRRGVRMSLVKLFLAFGS